MIRKFAVSFAIAGLLCISHSYGAEKAPSAALYSLPEAIIQNSHIRGLKHWYKMVGPSGYSSEAEVETKLPGLRAEFFDALKANPELIYQLYGLTTELLQIEQENPEFQNHAPTLVEVAGRGRYEKFKEGALWQIALKQTNGDAKRALLLFIGVHELFEQKFSFVSPGDPPQKIEFSAHANLAMVPRALDRDVDISDALKAKILTAHEWTEANAPKAKVYHFHLAAYIDCTLLKEGMPGWLVKDLGALTAVAYRGERLRIYLASLKKKKALTESDKISLDAAFLLGGPIPGFQDIGLFQFMTNPMVSSWLKAHEFISKRAAPIGWSQKRYQAALSRLELWRVDRAWTLAQHMAGYRFAEKVCTTQK